MVALARSGASEIVTGEIPAKIPGLEECAVRRCSGQIGIPPPQGRKETGEKMSGRSAHRRYHKPHARQISRMKGVRVLIVVVVGDYT